MKYNLTKDDRQFSNEPMEQMIEIGFQRGFILTLNYLENLLANLSQ